MRIRFALRGRPLERVQGFEKEIDVHLMADAFYG
jgi:hypothetical protein